MIRKGFGGIFCYNYIKEPPKSDSKYKGLEVYCTIIIIRNPPPKKKKKILF